jgi:hypothetical protein
MTRVVRVIWGRRETIYFCGEDWTGSIALKSLQKMYFGRASAVCRGAPRDRPPMLRKGRLPPMLRPGWPRSRRTRNSGGEPASGSASLHLAPNEIVLIEWASAERIPSPKPANRDADYEL